MGRKNTHFQARIPAFSELRTNYKIDFIFLEFHEFFDGVIGMKDLINLKTFIDLTNSKLRGPIFEIPLKYRKTQKK